MVDTTSTLVVRDGSSPPLTRNVGGTIDGSGTFYPEHSLRSDGVPVGAAAPLPVVAVSSALVNSAAGTMGAAAAIVVPYSATRKWLTICNRTIGVETQDIGSANVLVGSGIPVHPGNTFTFTGIGAAGPVYGITTVAGSAFSYVEG